MDASELASTGPSGTADSMLLAIDIVPPSRALLRRLEPLWRPLGAISRGGRGAAARRSATSFTLIR